MTDTDDKTVTGREPCPDCGSRDNLVRYADGHAHCFSAGCDRHEPPGGEGGRGVKKEAAPDPVDAGPLLAFVSGDLENRRISSATCARLGIGLAEWHGRPVLVQQYRDTLGTPKAQKVKSPDKRFAWIAGPFHGLFAASLWQPQANGVLAITEGELDTAAVYEASAGRLPVVSLANGASSVRKDLAASAAWLSEWGRIVLCFDNDDAGRQATAAALEVLPAGRVAVWQPEAGMKDAGDYQAAGRSAELCDMLRRAPLYRPADLLASGSMREMATADPTPGVPYAEPSLNDNVGGIYYPSIVTLVGGSGTGKTTLAMAIAHGLVQRGERVCILPLEDSPRDGLLKVLAFEAGERLVYKQGKAELIGKAFDACAADDQIAVYDTRGHLEFDRLEHLIRHAAAAGYRHLFLDHITALADALAGSNENGTVRAMMRRLAGLVQELGLALFMVAHTRKTAGTAAEEGGRITLDDLSGTKAVAQYSYQVWGLERDQQAENEAERGIITVRNLKDRLFGNVGRCTHLRFDELTHSYTPAYGQQADPFAKPPDAPALPAPDPASGAEWSDDIPF